MVSGASVRIDHGWSSSSSSPANRAGPASALETVAPTQSVDDPLRVVLLEEERPPGHAANL